MTAPAETVSTRPLDLASAAVMLVLSAVVLLEARTLAFWSDFAPGAGFMPVLIGIAGVVFAALLAYEAWTGPPKAADVPDRPGLIRAGSTAVALWGVLLLMPVLGFVLSAAIFALVILIVILRRPLLPSLAVTVITTGLVWGVFSQWLNVLLPKGPFGL